MAFKTALFHKLAVATGKQLDYQFPVTASKLVVNDAKLSHNI